MTSQIDAKRINLYQKILVSGRCKHALDDGNQKYPNNYILVQDTISFADVGIKLGVEFAQKDFLKWLEYEYDDIGELFMAQNLFLKLKSIKVHLRDKIEELKKSLEDKNEI